MKRKQAKSRQDVDDPLKQCDEKVDAFEGSPIQLLEYIGCGPSMKSRRRGDASSNWL